MKLLRAIILPSVIALSFVMMVLLIKGSMWGGLAVISLQTAGLVWIYIDEDEDSFVKESRKLWKTITSIF